MQINSRYITWIIYGDQAFSTSGRQNFLSVDMEYLG